MTENIYGIDLASDSDDITMVLAEAIYNANIKINDIILVSTPNTKGCFFDQCYSRES